MKIKKIVLIFICLFVFSGCSIDNISNNNIEKNVDLILKKRIKKVNTNAVGYQYYLPKYMSVIDSNEFNQEISGGISRHFCVGVLRLRYGCGCRLLR